MKYLFYMPSGAASGVAHRVQEEGHQVWMYIVQPHMRNLLKGIVPQVKSLQEGLSKKPDVIIFESVGYGNDAIKLRKQGWKVVGSGAEYQGKSFEDEIELDRSFGMKIMKDAGIMIPETTEFKGWQIDKAKKFVKDSKKRYVIKPDDNKNSETTYVSESPEDMIAHLEYIQKEKLLKPGDEFILQEFTKGIELSTEMWFSNGKPVFPANGTMETKKLMAEDLGPNTGCSSSVCWVYDTQQPKIIKGTLAKIYPLIEKVKYTGALDINCIVSEKDHKPYGLEWTSRMGYSAIYALIRLIDMDIAEALYLIANGRMKEFDHKSGFGYSVRVSIPPYPLAIKDENMKEKIYAETAGERFEYSGSEESIFYTEVMEDEKGQLVTAGVDGEICEITGYGKTMEEAVKEANGNFEKVKVPNKQARLDGFERVLKDIPVLQGFGYDGMPKINKEMKQSQESA